MSTRVWRLQPTRHSQEELWSPMTHQKARPLGALGASSGDRAGALASIFCSPLGAAITPQAGRRARIATDGPTDTAMMLAPPLPPALLWTLCLAAASALRLALLSPEVLEAQANVTEEHPLYGVGRFYMQHGLPLLNNGREWREPGKAQAESEARMEVESEMRWGGKQG